MDNDKFINAIDSIIKNLESVKDAMKGDTKSVSQPSPSINIELLANRLANTYSTMHPEYSIDSQFRNLKEMVNSSKMVYVVNWLCRSNMTGLEDFTSLSEEEKRGEMNKALDFFEKEIKGVFAKRFGK